MTTFQLLLMIASGVVFYLFFKQLFSDSYPKRGTDFEAKVADEQIGGISQPDILFSKPKAPTDRMSQLMENADEAIEKSDWKEAGKALNSLLILDPHHYDTRYKIAYVHLQNKEYTEAKKILEALIANNPTHDMAHALLANILHDLGEDEAALKHHKKAIMLDSEYAAHFFNYANTLYDRGEKKAALEQYQKSYALDSTLESAKQMIEKLSE